MLTVAGADATQFIVVGDTGVTSLAAGASRVVSLAFDPDAEGTRTPTLRIVSDEEPSTSP